MVMRLADVVGDPRYAQQLSKPLGENLSYCIYITDVLCTVSTYCMSHSWLSRECPQSISSTYRGLP